jgi:hypothetical protein
MTSLVAISEDVTVDPMDPRRRERLPVEVPAGVSAEGVGLKPSFGGGLMPMVVTEAPTWGLAEELMLGEIDHEMAVNRIILNKVSSDVSGEFRRALPGPVEIHVARVLNLDGQILIFEFEVPAERFILPDDSVKIDVSFEDGTLSSARVLVNKSSKPGLQKAGLTVRLALRLKDHQCWHHKAALIRWQSPARPVEIRVVL